MTKRSTTFTLRVGSEPVAVYTTLLHSYKHLKHMLPSRITDKFPHYNSINNRLRKEGSKEVFSTTMGEYSIEHMPLLLKFEP